MTTPNKDRADFEAWVSNPAQSRFLLDITKRDGDKYIYRDTMLAELAYQAACANKNAQLNKPNIVIVDLDDEKLVERVARGLCVKDGNDANSFYTFVDMPPDPVWRSCVNQAKSALAALKEK